MATYGEGEPTDNAREFHEWLKEDADGVDLSALHYTVFGLGNKTYQHFNAVGKFVDARLADLHATRAFVLGEGDDDSKFSDAARVPWRASPVQATTARRAADTNYLRCMQPRGGFPQVEARHVAGPLSTPEHAGSRCTGRANVRAVVGRVHVWVGVGGCGGVRPHQSSVG